MVGGRPGDAAGALWRTGGRHRPVPKRGTRTIMTATQDVDTDADLPDDDTAAPGVPPVAEVPPPRAQRVDVRRRLMALRRW